MPYEIFERILVRFKKLQNYVLFYQEPEVDPDKKFPEPERPQNRPAPKPCLFLTLSHRLHIFNVTGTT